MGQGAFRITELVACSTSEGRTIQLEDLEWVSSGLPIPQAIANGSVHTGPDG